MKTRKENGYTNHFFMLYNFKNVFYLVHFSLKIEIKFNNQKMKKETDKVKKVLLGFNLRELPFS